MARIAAFAAASLLHSHPARRCRSSVVEHSLGKGEVVSSILTGSTNKSGISRNAPLHQRAERNAKRRLETHQIRTKCSADVRKVRDTLNWPLDVRGATLSKDSSRVRERILLDFSISFAAASGRVALCVPKGACDPITPAPAQGGR
jgi:hypothetical protein